MKMKIRISRELKNTLKRVTQQTGLGTSEIVRRALRHWDRVGRPDVGSWNGDGATTYGGTVITIDGVEGFGANPTEVRHATAWRLRMLEDELQELKPFRTKLKEGVDYLVAAG